MTMAGNDLTQYMASKPHVTKDLELKIVNSNMVINLGLIQNASVSEQYRHRSAQFKVLKLTTAPPE